VKEITSQVQKCLKQAIDITNDHGGRRPFKLSRFHFVADPKSVNDGLKAYWLPMNAGRNEFDARSLMSDLTNDFSKTASHAGPVIRTETSHFPKAHYPVPVQRSALSIRLTSSPGQEMEM
jgi:hypothetical protein